jgi:hypothetical protein
MSGATASTSEPAPWVAVYAAPAACQIAAEVVAASGVAGSAGVCAVAFASSGRHLFCLNRVLAGQVVYHNVHDLWDGPVNVLA